MRRFTLFALVFVTACDGGEGPAPIDAGEDGGTIVDGCGDGVVDGEECDDGNALSGDGCSASCAEESGWVCDPNCTELCGDGVMVGDEACDDGAETPCGLCNADCSGPGAGVCGDGVICTETERCDDANSEGEI